MISREFWWTGVTCGPTRRSPARAEVPRHRLPLIASAPRDRRSCARWDLSSVLPPAAAAPILPCHSASSFAVCASAGRSFAAASFSLQFFPCPLFRLETATSVPFLVSSRPSITTVSIVQSRNCLDGLWVFRHAHPIEMLTDEGSPMASCQTACAVGPGSGKTLHLSCG